MKKNLALGTIGLLMAFSSCNTKNQKAKNPSSLRINFKEEPTSLDPRRGRNLAGASHLHAMLFEGLMRLDPNGDLSCAQASSYEISPDQKTYTFHIGNTFWSDGTPVTAYDFEKTWKDILDPQFPALDSNILYCIKNASAAKKGEVSLEGVGIHAKNAKTLVIELEHPTPHFLHTTASNILYPINQTQNHLFPNWFAEAGEHFVCNGPFRLSQWKHNNNLVFTKNTGYRLANEVKLDEIRVSLINNDSATLHMYETGDLDIIGLPISPLPFTSYPDLMQKNELRIFEAPGTMVCMFNTKRFPFYNANIRKAFSYAINRQVLIDQVTLLKENPALGIIPPHLKQTQARPYFEDGNVQMARTFFQKGLEELGIEASDLNGKTTFSYWSQDHACPLLPQALQREWNTVLGIDVELEALEYKTLHEKGKNGLLSMGYFVFMSYDPIDLLGRFKSAQNARNYARWQNDAYADLLDKAAQSSSQGRYFALLDQAEALLMEEMPYAPVFHWNYTLLIQPYVKGFSVSPLGYLCFDRISIEKNGTD
jgi:oligopeptide transport system substrate-binding protein